MKKALLVLLAIPISALIWYLLIVISVKIGLGTFAVFISHMSFLGWLLFIGLVVFVTKLLIKVIGKPKIPESEN